MEAYGPRPIPDHLGGLPVGTRRQHPWGSGRNGDDLMRSPELPEVLALIDAYITTAFKSDLQTLAAVAVGDITFMLCVVY